MFTRRLLLIDSDYAINPDSDNPNGFARNFGECGVQRLRAMLQCSRTRIARLYFQNSSKSIENFERKNINSWINSKLNLNNNFLLVISAHGFNFCASTGEGRIKFENMIRALKRLDFKGLSHLTICLEMCDISYQATRYFHSKLNGCFPKNYLIISSPVGIYHIQTRNLSTFEHNSNYNHIHCKEGRFTSYDAVTGKKYPDLLNRQPAALPRIGSSRPIRPVASAAPHRLRRVQSFRQLGSGGSRQQPVISPREMEKILYPNGRPRQRR